MSAIIYVVRMKDGIVEPVGIRPAPIYNVFPKHGETAGQEFLGLVASVSMDSCGEIGDCIVIYTEGSSWTFGYVDREEWEYYGKVMTSYINFMETVDCLIREQLGE